MYIVHVVFSRSKAGPRSSGGAIRDLYELWGRLYLCQWEEPLSLGGEVSQCHRESSGKWNCTIYMYIVKVKYWVGWEG